MEQIEPRCPHCEYLGIVEFVQRFSIPVSLSNPNWEGHIPAGWAALDENTFVRRCPTHGGKEFDPKSGRTLKVWLEYEVGARCTGCGTRLNVRVFDGMPPKGHDDGIRYQEILSIGIGKCPKCSVVVASVLQ